MKVKSNVKAGGNAWNHNERLVADRKRRKR